MISKKIPISFLYKKSRKNIKNIKKSNRQAATTQQQNSTTAQWKS